MTHWTVENMNVEVKSGDVLAEPADVLICSANVYLNQSGGVGGEILRRHGEAIQRSLHRHLIDNGLKFVQPGEIVITDGNGTGFRHIVHAIAVDAWYHSSRPLVAKVLIRALKQASELGAKTVAVVAVATGYGRLSMRDFACGLREAIREAYPSIEKIAVVVRREDDAKEIREVLDQTA